VKSAIVTRSQFEHDDVDVGAGEQQTEHAAAWATAAMRG
jgi:hypothetical protein